MRRKGQGWSPRKYYHLRSRASEGVEEYWEIKGELRPQDQKNRGFEKEKEISSSLFRVSSPCMGQIPLEAHQLSGII